MTVNTAEQDVDRRRERLQAHYQRLSLVAMLRDFAYAIQERAAELDGFESFTRADIEALYDAGKGIEGLADILDGAEAIEEVAP